LIYEQLIHSKQDAQFACPLLRALNADVAEIIMNGRGPTLPNLIKLLDSEKNIGTLTELDVDVREPFLAKLSARKYRRNWK